MEKNTGNKMKEFWKVEEEWRDVNGYKRLYQVSNFGNVRSWRGGKWKLLKPSKRDGFLYVSLSDGKSKVFPIHHLVAEAFMPDYSKTYITHINGDRANNCVLNLEWAATKGESIQRFIEINKLKEDFTGYKIKDSQ
ncbi:NUMOD4 domain-containing protein [Neobacillus drentensis]|uniref:NUMOD4 domain-containing protein n=1 Tax=Neobacillus drentensis TaxID=220684 RepID=UPI00082564CD|nr:NUMOD4 domain-containing protein [Neobacillus drentensis]